MSEAEFTITLAQLNPTVGDVTGNAAKARAAREKAREAGADLMVLPELFICGYPPEDLVLKPALQAACRAAVEELARETADGGPAVLIGTPWVEDGKLYNACALLDEGRIAALRFKANLPNYGVFDEKRLFARGPAAGPVTVKGIRVGVPICEDIWLEESEDYENVVECLAETGAEILVVPNGSPYARDKNDIRLSIAVARVTESGLPLIYLNEVGGQDELVFDGASFALNADLTVAAQLPAFEQSITTLRWTRSDAGWRCNGPVAELPEGDKGDYAACVLGLRDYVRKNGFPGVLLGVSGGIDSALCAAMAVDALGADQVRGVMLPFRFTAQVSLDDAAKLARALGIRYEVLPIADAVNGFEKILSVPFAGLPRDITEENLQARKQYENWLKRANSADAEPLDEPRAASRDGLKDRGPASRRTRWAAPPRGRRPPSGRSGSADSATIRAPPLPGLSRSAYRSTARARDPAPGRARRTRRPDASARRHRSRVTASSGTMRRELAPTMSIVS